MPSAPSTRAPGSLPRSDVPIFAFDIFPDGRALPAPDMAPEGPGAYRWMHWDRDDPGLEEWCAAHLAESPGEALQHRETRPRCDQFGDGLILNLRGINMNPGQAEDQMVSIRLWVTRTLIVSVRRRRVFAVEDIRRACAEGNAPATPGDFLDALVDGLAWRIRDVALGMERRTADLEIEIETDDEPDAAPLKEPRLSVLRMLRYLKPQREALHRLLDLSPMLMDEEDRLDLREPVNLTLYGVETLESIKSRLETLQDYAEARAAARLGRNSYALSVVAAIFLPLSFITGLFGVNVADLPGLETPGAFWILCAGMAALAAICILILRWLRLF